MLSFFVCCIIFELIFIEICVEFFKAQKSSSMEVFKAWNKRSSYKKIHVCFSQAPEYMTSLENLKPDFRPCFYEPSRYWHFRLKSLVRAHLWLHVLRHLPPHSHTTECQSCWAIFQELKWVSYIKDILGGFLLKLQSRVGFGICLLWSHAYKLWKFIKLGKCYLGSHLLLS